MDGSILEPLRLAILSAVSWLFLVAVAALLVLLARRTILWLRARRRARIAAMVVPQVHLKVRTASGAVSLYTYDFTPVSVASFGSPDLFLPGPGSRRLHLRLDLRPGAMAQTWFTADSPLLVNGVPCRKKALKPGDRFLFGSYSLEFQGVLVRRPPRLLPQAPAFGWQAPGIAALLFLGILFGRPAPATGRSGQVAERPAAKEVAVKAREATAPLPAPPARKVSETRARAAKDVRRPAAAKVVRQPPAATKRALARPGLRETRVTAPGEAPQYFPVDILFFHAHPDDESLAFGAMMAAASRAGKRLATVLFTDGEAGKDFYPNRPAGGRYPNRALHGAELAEIRVQEARSALGVLGCEAYIRLGLRNHPYNTFRDEASAEQVVADWGGEQELVARLEALLRGFRPRIVVSPEGHSGRRGHFEHEAVGLLVARAVATLRREGTDFLQGHLVPVDPAARGWYPTLVEIDAWSTDPASGLTYRQIQALALQEHVSQRDASLLGRKRLPRLPKEYYRPLDWELEASLQEYLAQPPGEERTGAF